MAPPRQADGLAAAVQGLAGHGPATDASLATGALPARPAGSCPGLHEHPAMTSNSPSVDRGPGFFWREATCWLGFGAVGFGFNILGPVLPTLRRSLGAGYSELALLFVAAAAGSGLANLFATRLLGRIGYRPFLVLSAGVYAMVLLTAVAAHSLLVWALALGVGAFGGSSTIVSALRLVTDNEADGRGRGRALNFLNMFYGVGGLVAPAVVALLAGAGIDPLDAFVLASVVLLALSGMALHTMAATAPPTFGESGMAAGLRWAARQGPVVRLALLVGVYVGCEVAFSGWVASYAHAVHHLSIAAAAVYPLAFWAAATLGRSVAAERSRHWSERRILTFAVAVALGGGVLALWGPGPWGLGAGAVLVGLGFGPIYPTSFALAAHQPRSHRSEVFGLLFISGGLGNLVLPWIAGQLFALLGGGAALAVPLAGTAAMAALLVWIRARGEAPAVPA